MKRSLFLIAFAGAALAFAALRPGIAVRSRGRSGHVAGGCVNHARRLRWSGYTAADLS